MQTDSIDTQHTPIFQSALSYIAGILELANLEVKLSVQSIYRAFAYILIATVLIITSWLSCLFALSVVLHEYGLSWGYSLLAVLGINVLLLLTSLLLAKFYFKSIGFNRTLAQLKLF